MITTSPAATWFAEPAAIVMLWSLGLGGAVSTAALTRLKSAIVGGPR